MEANQNSLKNKVKTVFKDSAPYVLFGAIGLGGLGSLASIDKILAVVSPDPFTTAASENKKSFRICAATATGHVANLTAQVVSPQALTRDEKQYIANAFAQVVNHHSSDQYLQNIPSIQIAASTTALTVQRDIGKPVRVFPGPLTYSCN